ncbi:MAG: spermidine synthase [Dehalococcoidia bacterium]|nr:MAG: spermidine synthase [Dehalococcoidia bacterium]
MTTAPQSIVRPVTAGVVRASVLTALLALSLLLTGASGLMYQVVWFRVLGLVFGVTVHATSAVLAAFMAGLAIGSLLAARVTDRLKNPLLAYGLVELAIGVLGLLSLPALGLLQPIYRALALQLPDSLLLVTSVRFALAFAIMLLPTTLMGVTLPLVVRAVVQRAGSLSGAVSFLYGANTFGAIAGAFLAGFVLIGSFGVPATVGIAAAFNLVVGLLWTILATGPLRPSLEIDEAVVRAVSAEAPRFRVSPAVATTVLIAYGLSGFVALAYEVVWTRVLAGILPSTVYAFTLMLCAILSGIAVGSWAINPLLKRRVNWVVVFVALEIAIAALALLSLAFMAQATRLEAFLLRGAPEGAFLLGRPQFMIPFTFAAIFPVAFLMGVTFPIAAMLYAAGQTDVGRRIGSVYGANVLGAVSGSLAAGLILIPLFGAQRALWLLSLGNVLAGLAVLLVARLPFRLSVALSAVGATVLLVAAVASPNLYVALSEGEARGLRTVWLHEGQDATVSVVRGPDDRLYLRINSQGMGSDGGAQARFHHRLGHLGPLIHPSPRELLIIGLGVGATAGASALHPNLHVTIVELVPGVVDAADLFRSANFDVLQRPNVRLTIDDGRNYLLLTDRKFDIIESDPILPRNAGAANLYSADFYRLVRGALKDDGIFVQWVDPTLPPAAHRMMVRTFLSEFPGATMWENGAILVGSRSPLQVPPERLTARLQDPRIAAVLEADGLRTAEDILRGYVGGPRELALYAGDGPIMTDANPYIEYYLSLPSGGTVPDLRWLPAAAHLAATARAGDAIVYGNPAFQPLLAALPIPPLPDYVLPAEVPLDAATEATLQELAAKGRVWFVPTPGSRRDEQVISLLGRTKRLAEDRQHVLVRMLLFD